MALQYRLGTCTMCKSEGIMIVKRLPSGNYCLLCNEVRLGKGDEKPKSSIKFKKKEPTGELVLFNVLWAARAHRSFIDDQWLGDVMSVSFMAHVLPKAKNRYPLFKLYDKNIVLLSFDQHFAWDNGLRSELRLLPEWDKMFALEEELKEEYKKLN